MKVVFCHDLEPDPEAALKNFGVVIKKSSEGESQLLFPHSIAETIGVLECGDVEKLVHSICEKRARVSIVSKLKWQIHEVNCAVSIFEQQVKPWLLRDALCRLSQVLF